MAACRYEISLLVFNLIDRNQVVYVYWKRNFISTHSRLLSSTYMIITIRENAFNFQWDNLSTCNATLFWYFAGNRQNGQRRANPCPVDREELVYEKVRKTKCLFSRWISGSPLTCNTLICSWCLVNDYPFKPWGVSLGRVKSSGIRQSKIYKKCTLRV